MTEGSFPKINGDAMYASEINKMWNYFGDGSDGALAVAAGTTSISSVKNYTSISVSAGATLNLTDYSWLYVTGDVTLNGTLTASSPASPISESWFALNGTGGTGPGGVGTGAAGGTSRYPLLLFVLGNLTVTTTGAITFDGVVGTAGTPGAGGIGGTSGGGGGGGALFGAGGIGGVRGGDSGGGAAGAGAIAVISYYKNPLYIPIPFTQFSYFGSNGGAGGNQTNTAGGGAGGGGAGSTVLIFVKGDITVQAAGTITANGGVGGVGGSPGVGTNGGGGGGGGSGGVICIYHNGTYTNAGTVTVSGGAGAAGGGNAGAGAAGESGIIVTHKV